jgi:hypothetical protein
MHSLAHQDQKERITRLLGIAVASIVAWQTWLGGLILYPFSILATWFHERGINFGGRGRVTM